MHRFYIYQEDVTGNVINVGHEEAKHAYSVLRLRKEASVAAFDGKGKEYLGTLVSLSSKKGIIRISEAVSVLKDNTDITLAAAIPKLSKFDSIVDKATQLGVNNLIPMQSERTVVRISQEKAAEKRLRWQRIAVEAAKQCGCSYVPEIAPVTDFSTLLMRISKYSLALIPSLHKGTVSLKKIAKAGKPRSTIIFIGPEGDFTEEEARNAEENGAIGVTLGKNVLRCETAVTMVLSVLNYEWKL
ncbi:MAG: 16S rRNA (uracil(1498)-N(3))-methyltransferase [Candidatus Omnitrophica bacterium]|nr:16S rRNA (uracil(1498)-N(3))-methyltransferase [Candidatus Omnitrophota bacterium]